MDASFLAILGVTALFFGVVLGGVAYRFYIGDRLRLEQEGRLQTADLLKQKLKELETREVERVSLMKDAERAQQAWANEREKLVSDLDEARRRYAETKEIARNPRELPPKVDVHHVIMDGMSQAGKSTMIARIVNPTGTPEDLQKIGATVADYRTVDIPVCWSRGDERNHLHSLSFHDIAGEDAGTFINALVSWTTSNEMKGRQAVLLIVWNLADFKEGAHKTGKISGLKTNRDYMNEHRLAATYSNVMFKNIVGQVVVFFNKTDMFDNAQILEDHLEKEKAYIRQLLTRFLGDRVGEPRFVYGSATLGTGVQDCYGEILRLLGLQEHFEQVTGNPIHAVAGYSARP